uniref:ANF_receptor domain-containing protein n=1 Tax=Parastrongyloides trichosuri TaxID=131310 RepID=A0A0N5A7I8_PARTI
LVSNFCNINNVPVLPLTSSSNFISFKQFSKAYSERVRNYDSKINLFHLRSLNNESCYHEFSDNVGIGYSTSSMTLLAHKAPFIILDGTFKKACKDYSQMYSIHIYTNDVRFLIIIIDFLKSKTIKKYKFF